jgi:uncharacterized membrane protein YkoI
MGDPHPSPGSGRPARPGPWRGTRRAVALLLALVGVLGFASGCAEGGEEGRTEVHPEVEALYDQAIRLSLEQVPDSELLQVVLRHREGGQPVWRSRVVNPDGTAHLVTLTATTGDLVRKSVPGAVEPASEETMTLLEEAVLVPEEAARKVTKPDFGKVTLVELGERGGGPVWFVEVTTVEEDHVRRTTVDAVSGEILDSTPLPEDAGRHGDG